MVSNFLKSKGLGGTKPWLFESTRAHKKTASVEIRWRFSVCRRFGFSCGWIRTAAALSQKTAQKQPGGLFLAARLA